MLVRLGAALMALLCTVTVLEANASATTVPLPITLDGVLVQLGTGTRQVITVHRTAGTHARITFWSLGADGRWIEEHQSSSARIGYGGLVVGALRRQDTGTTPIGTFPLLFSFGTVPRRTSWSMPYRRITSQDYWVEDNRSAFYNRFRSRGAGGFRYWLDTSNLNGSEHLSSYPRQYRMAVVIGFNYDHPVRYRGAGIFLHVNGRGATAGCVSAPRAFLRTALALLDPRLHPEIAIGG